MANPQVSEEDRITRASFTLKQAFLDFRKATWHLFIKDVVNQGKTIALHQDSSQADRYNGWYSHFPNLVAHDVHVRDAVLTTMSCHEIGHMKKLVEQLFEGIDVLIEEVRVRQKPTARRTIIVDETGKIDHNDYDFWLMRVTSRSTGTQWAIDLSGPQYDIQFPGFRWDFLLKYFVKEVLAVVPFGTLAEYTARMIDAKGIVGLELEIGAGAMRRFHEVVDPAMEKKGLTWAIILGKEDKDYMRHGNKVLKVARNAIEAYVAGENLTKRRQKAERYEDRHEEEIDVERKRSAELLLG